MNISQSPFLLPPPPFDITVYTQEQALFPFADGETEAQRRKVAGLGSHGSLGTFPFHRSFCGRMACPSALLLTSVPSPGTEDHSVGAGVGDGL